MITYVINSVVQNDQTVNVNVTYTLSNGPLNLIVPIFMPSNSDDIISGVVNRGITEQNKLDFNLSINDVILSIPIGLTFSV